MNNKGAGFISLLFILGILAVAAYSVFMVRERREEAGKADEPIELFKAIDDAQRIKEELSDE